MKNHIKIGIRELALGAGIAGAAIVFMAFRFIWIPLLISAIIAFIINPLVCLFEKKGASRSTAILTTYFLLFIFLALFFYAVVPVILDESQSFAKIFPGYMEKWHREVWSYFLKFSRRKLPDYLQNSINSAIVMLEERLRIAFMQLVSGLLNFFRNIPLIFLIPFFTYYISRDFSSFKRKIFCVYSQQEQGKVLDAVQEMNRVLNLYLRGQLFIAFMVGIMVTMGLLLLKIEFAVLIGIFAGLLNLIPYFGSVIGAIPAVLLGLVQSPWTAFYVIILFITINQIEAFFLSPKILGNSLGLHPLVIFLAILFAGKFFGFLGMLFIMPILGIGKVLFKYALEALAGSKVNG
ncbi:MAG: AI-2E family transporter [Bacillota bacterium]